MKAYDKNTGESITFNSIADEQFSTNEQAKKCARYIRSQIVSGFDHFEYSGCSDDINIVYQDGNEQPVNLEF